VGQWTTNASSQWWGLYVNTNGSQLILAAQGGGVETNYLSAPISWTTNEWHVIQLVYGPSNSTLYVDWVRQTNGAGISVYPGATIRSNVGLTIGSDSQGTNVARGQFQNLATYNYRFGNREVKENYVNTTILSQAIKSVMNQDAIENPRIFSSFLTGETNYFLAPISITVNGTLVSINVLYDSLPASESLEIYWKETATNTVWAHLTNGLPGQTSITFEKPSTNVFSAFVLGDHRDSDGDGLTDGYEFWVSGTLVNHADQNTNGIPDGWEILNGFSVATDHSGDNDDFDTLTNYAEYLLGTDPRKTDTDGDGIPDDEDSQPLFQDAPPVNIYLKYVDYSVVFNEEQDSTEYYDYAYRFGSGATNIYDAFRGPPDGDYYYRYTERTTWPWNAGITNLGGGTYVETVEPFGISGGRETNAVLLNEEDFVGRPNPNDFVFHGDLLSYLYPGSTTQVTRKFESELGMHTTGTNNSVLRAYRVHFSGTNATTGVRITNYTGISIMSSNVDVNGNVFVVVNDATNKAYDLAFPSALSNVVYKLEPSLVKIPLEIRTSGTITPGIAGTNLGNETSIYYVNTTGTNILGAAIPLRTFNPPNQPSVSLFLNGQETVGTVSTNEMPQTGWKLHRDAHVRRFIWKGGTNLVENVETEANLDFSGAPPGNGSEDTDDPLYDVSDKTPDILGRIFFFDAPAIVVSEYQPYLPNAPVGSVAALRFFAHEWATLNNGLASEIKHWHSYITLKKESNGQWQRIGTNNIISVSAPNLGEVARFSLDEAKKQ
jgi:hypothetical protein